MSHDAPQPTTEHATVPATDQPYDADPAPRGGTGATARRPWLVAAATGVAGVVAGGVLGATLSSAGADASTQNGPGQMGGTGQMGGPPGQQGGTQQGSQQGGTQQGQPGTQAQTGTQPGSGSAG